MAFWRRVSSVFGRPAAFAPKDESVDRATLLAGIRACEVFRECAAEHVERMLNRMETVAVRDGDVVIREGEEGDSYYLLATGTAKVTRHLRNEAKPHEVAQFLRPTGFGEDALISIGKRNATVTMTSDGILMRLSKDAFDRYVKDPMISWASGAEARAMVEKGARWVDVRPPEHASQPRIAGAIPLPLEDLRDHVAALDKDTTYVCFCTDGRLSSTAAFLLRQYGLHAVVVRDGLGALHPPPSVP